MQTRIRKRDYETVLWHMLLFHATPCHMPITGLSLIIIVDSFSYSHHHKCYYYSYCPPLPLYISVTIQYCTVYDKTSTSRLLEKSYASVSTYVDRITASFLASHFCFISHPISCYIYCVHEYVEYVCIRCISSSVAIHITHEPFSLTFVNHNPFNTLTHGISMDFATSLLQEHKQLCMHDPESIS